MRDAFSGSLFDLASKNKKLVLLTGDLGYTVFEKFSKKHKKRYINLGVAEANMMGMACGMAMEGMIPVVYSITNFVTMRGFEQIRNDICRHKANVKIVGTGGGLSYGHAGSTHHSLEDIALMKILPNMVVICPSDAVMTSWATREIISYQGPVYLRLGKKGEPIIYDSKTKFKTGKGIMLREGKHGYLISCGNLVYNALLACDILKRQGLKIGVIDMHTIKPLDVKLITQLLIAKIPLFTLEEHYIGGGLGSSVSEVISRNINGNKILFKAFGVPNIFIEEAGSQNELRERFGLTPDKISAKIKIFLKKYA